MGSALLEGKAGKTEDYVRQEGLEADGPGIILYAIEEEEAWIPV